MKSPLLPVIPESASKKIVIIAALVLLIGFFILPWAGGGVSRLYADSDRGSDVYGDNATEIAAYAPVLWLIPVGALLTGVIVFKVDEASRKTWVNWLLILLMGGVILYPMAVGRAPDGSIDLPLSGGVLKELIQRYHRVLVSSDPANGYFLSLAADGVIVIFSLGNLLQKRAAKVRMKEIGILFDIDELGFDSYGRKAYTIFFKNLDPEQLTACTLFDGGISETLAGQARLYCIAVQSPDASGAKYVKEIFSQCEDKGLVTVEKRFLEGDVTRQQSLVQSAEINGSGYLLVRIGSRISKEWVKGTAWANRLFAL